MLLRSGLVVAELSMQPLRRGTALITALKRRTISSAPPPQRKTFIGQFIDNIKSEMARNKEMKESLKKFRQEAEKLEQSEALQKARQKYQNLEAETQKSSAVLHQKLESLKSKLQEKLEEAQKTELSKKAGQITDELSKSAMAAAEKMAEKGQQMGNTGAFKSISEGVKAVKQEIDDSTLPGARVYKAPKVLKKRADRSYAVDEQKPVEANPDATGVELHKDSRWAQNWQHFKDNNPYVNTMFDWKTRYDESDNAVVRASRVLTEKVSDIFGGLFQTTELSTVLTEICKIDSTFDKSRFLVECEQEIIPNILEAMIRGDLEILRDWLNEAPYNIIAEPIKMARQKGCRFDSKVLDLSNVELVMGKMMDEVPVLVISFQTQQIMVLRDVKGAVVEGDEEKILRMYYVWVLCRDQSILDPKTAWKLMDLSANSVEQWL